MMIHRKTTITTFFALCLIIISLFFPNRTIGQSQSPPPSSAPNAFPLMTLSVTAPTVIEASNSNLDFFVKCKLTNRDTAPTPSAVIQRARIYLIDSASHTQKLLHYTTGIYDGPVLAPGQSTTWWQHGRATTGGRFRLFTGWDGDDTVQSAPIPVTIRRSAIQPDGVKPTCARLLRQFANRFPEIVPNTSTATVYYTSITFTNDPIVVDGSLYQAFSFIVPQRGGDLEWSFVIRNPLRTQVSWFIVPAEGTIEGFTEFFRDTVIQHIPDIADPGDRVIVQSLSAEQLIPHHRYYIWFQCPYRDIPTVTLSLNIFADGPHPLRDIFRGVYDGP